MIQRKSLLIGFLLVLFAFQSCSRKTGHHGELTGVQDAAMKPAPSDGYADEGWEMYAPEDNWDEEKPDPFGNESYDEIVENEFRLVKDQPLSTFSVDVDRASYANIRRMLNFDQLPPANAVRIEEMINYFNYSYPDPMDDAPIALYSELSDCPWNPAHKLARIALKGKSLDLEDAPKSNLVFLLDVSGSMSDYDKLPLLKKSLKLLVNNMREEDRVAIVVYASASGLVLGSTSARKKDKIIGALEKLDAGGSTAGGEGLRLAYKVAEENFIKNGNNRVILATDGDFNVGESSDEAMVKLIEEKRESGIFISVLGFGRGNLKDSKMEKIADKGNGNYAYIDNLLEAKKVLVKEMGGTLFTIAKDVKLQVEFNPTYVTSYRLIGYENRLLKNEDFNDDKKDAGEMGAGHSVTALYELIPAGTETDVTASIDPLKYQETNKTSAANSYELMQVKFRYKEPDGDTSKLISQAILNGHENWNGASQDFRFAACVAHFGLILRNSQYMKAGNYESLIMESKSAKGEDDEGYRAEFIQLLEKAALISPEEKTE